MTILRFSFFRIKREREKRTLKCYQFSLLYFVKYQNQYKLNIRYFCNKIIGPENLISTCYLKPFSYYEIKYMQQIWYRKPSHTHTTSLNNYYQISTLESTVSSRNKTARHPESSPLCWPAIWLPRCYVNNSLAYLCSLINNMDFLQHYVYPSLFFYSICLSLF